MFKEIGRFHPKNCNIGERVCVSLEQVVAEKLIENSNDNNMVVEEKCIRDTLKLNILAKVLTDKDLE